MLKTSRIEEYVETIKAIAASPRVSEFTIGYTSRSGRARHQEYKYWEGYQHLVLIADRLTLPDSHALERRLQETCQTDKRSALYRKYSPTRRDNRYYPSAGQAKSDPNLPIHSVYMAWWSDE
ncbi:hypothetical protein I6F07_19470 [Ensifer sp. IC4062]|nr:hypothetical protein [Ensifer sp. IC4062]MCA1442355.1 hypothetical protein [Ensifer sp. IC4062]